MNVEVNKISRIKRVEATLLGFRVASLHDGEFDDRRGRTAVVNSNLVGQKLVRVTIGDDIAERMTTTEITARFYDKYSSGLPPYVIADRTIIKRVDDFRVATRLAYRPDVSTGELGLHNVLGTLATAHRLQGHPIDPTTTQLSLPPLA